MSIPECTRLDVNQKAVDILSSNSESLGYGIQKLTGTGVLACSNAGRLDLFDSQQSAVYRDTWVFPCVSEICKFVAKSYFI